MQAGDLAVIESREWSRLAEELQQERVRLGNRIPRLRRRQLAPQRLQRNARLELSTIPLRLAVIGSVLLVRRTELDRLSEEVAALDSLAAIRRPTQARDLSMDQCRYVFAEPR